MRIVFAFFSLAFAGSLVLMLPGMLLAGQELPWLDRLFVAVSAVTVTGLTPVEISSTFSRVGQLVILVLIQIGGLGIMTLASAILLNLGKRVSIHGYISARQTVESYTLMEDPRKIIKTVAVFTLGCEFVFFLAIWLLGDFSPWQAVFHSISAFCNAGFSTLAGGLAANNQQHAALLLIAFEFILGGIGFTVVYNLYRHYRYRHDLAKRRLAVHTRLVLLATAILLLSGWLVVLVSEWNTSLAAYQPFEKILYAFFTSATTRTAGFEAVPTSSLHASTLFFLMILMYIGASPGSTGGGVKTTTASVFFVEAWQRLRGHQHVAIFHRRLPRGVLERAAIVLVVMFMLVGVTTFMLLSLEPELSATRPMSLLFEAVSALGTVGLSTGVTAQLGGASKLTLMVAMLLGRMGPIGLALLIQQSHAIETVSIPSEEVMIG